MTIAIDNVSKNYGNLHVLENVSLTIEDSTFVTILGASGCGKSTLLNMLAGLTPASAGRLVLDGKPITKPGPDRVVVFQQPGLYPWLSLRDNIAFGLKMRAPRKIDWDLVDRLIGIIGLTGFESHKPYELSGGMQQRVAIARALVMQPRVLLMDEPFGALDAQTRRVMQQFLLDLWERIHATVVFITHDIDEAILLGERLVVMSTHPGRIALVSNIDLPRPRHWEMMLEPVFLDLKRQAMEILAI